MPRKKITTDCTFRGLPINTGKDNTLGCNIRILDAAYNLLDNYTRAHSQVLVVHLCLTFGFGYIDFTNDTLKRFMNNYTRDLGGRGYDPGFLWCREQNIAETQHYHVAVLVNRNKVQSPKTIEGIAQKHWENVTGTGYARLCDARELRRNSVSGVTDISSCFYWLSYWAKERTKDLQPSNLRMFSASQPKHIYCKQQRQ